MGAGREALILCVLCEHIAIPVVLVSLFSTILNRIFSIRIACYVHSCKILLNVLVILKTYLPRG